MLDKSRVDRELARRLCAAFISHQMGVTVATQYKKTPEDVGICGTSWPLWPTSWRGRARIPCTETWDPWRLRLFNRRPRVTRSWNVEPLAAAISPG
jgi:hypothetical protein